MARIYSFSSVTLADLATAIAEGVEVFDTVTYEDNVVKIKDDQGRLVATIDSVWVRFYDYDGNNDLTGNAYYNNIGVCKNGVVVFVNNTSNIIIITKSNNGEYACIHTSNSGSNAKCVSRSSYVTKEYSFGGGTEDVQTMLSFFPLSTGTHEYDCTKYAYWSVVYQSNTYTGIVLVNNVQYLQAGRFFIKD